ncbi:TonB family protein [Microvirga sp. STR05]|uniref:TonB family protein n=1 Tax=Hymenobacter duratus TaxID=2771356 RepID=A0ABR8JJZ3_9BACT|nr:TonB family protein [Hymenobacter duratus]MBD2717184.1 TonB family protein [Hymenobacter duratus]MBR7952100.1 TonB family protein [Microvirga sp. STR05]
MRPDNQSPSSLLPAGSAGEHLPLALLRQYVAGTLPATEQYRVERHTQACPRCADVLEGLSLTNQAATDKSLSELQARLRARVAELEPDVVVPAGMFVRPWQQLAAVVLLLLVGTGVWLGLRRSSDGPTAAPPVALRQPAATPETYATVPPAATSPAPDVEVADKSVVTPEAAASVPSVALNTSPVKARRSAKPTRIPADTALESGSGGIAMASAPVALANAEGGQGISGEAASAANSISTADDEATKQTVAAPQVMTKAKSKAATARMQAAAAPAAIDNMAKNRIIDASVLSAGTRTVRGRVTNYVSGEGLGGVQIRANGVSTGVSTAADGSFSVSIPAAATTLAFEAAGYLLKEQVLAKDSNEVKLTLAPKPTEAPVLVRREKAPATIDLAATPAGGQRAFRDYLRDSLEYPEKAMKDEKEGSVKLSFLVNVDGTLQNIKVVKGLTEECDAEAIRLLQEGPAWHPAIINGRRTARTVQISIPFRIADHQ